VKPVQDVLAYFGADERVGQTEEQVKKAQEKYGFNGEAVDPVVSELITYNRRTDQLPISKRDPTEYAGK